jgi:hypothetical protein
MKTLAALALFALILSAGAQAQSPPQTSQDESSSQPKDTAKSPKKTTKLHVVVTAGEDPKPVAHAQVDVTWKGEGETISTSAHTDPGGMADLTVPRGKVQIQVIAEHWSSGGTFQDLQGEKETVKIKLSVQAANN